MAIRGFRNLKKLEDKKNSYEEEKGILEYLETATNYKELLKIFKDAIIFNGEGFCISIGLWINYDNDNKTILPRLGIRWNGECGSMNFPNGYMGRPLWLMLDNRFAKAIIEEIPKIDKNKVEIKIDKNTRKKILKFLGIENEKKEDI